MIELTSKQVSRVEALQKQHSSEISNLEVVHEKALVELEASHKREIDGLAKENAEIQKLHLQQPLKNNEGVEEKIVEVEKIVKVEVEKIVIKEAEKPQTSYKQTQTKEVTEPTLDDPDSAVAEIAPPADCSPEETKEEQPAAEVSQES